MKSLLVAACAFSLPSADARGTCCYSKWGDSSSCGDYVGPGARCSTDPSKSCGSDGDCPDAPVPTPTPVPTPPAPTPPAPTPTPPAPSPSPAPTPTPPAPSPPPPAPPGTKSRCCWSKWGDASSCGLYPDDASGPVCSLDWQTPCNGDGDCEGVVPPPPPGPAPPPPPHPPAPPAPPLPAKTSQELLGWYENWGPDINWWNTNYPYNCAMGCVKNGMFIKEVEPYSTLNYGFALLGKHPNAAQVGCGNKGDAGPCPTWDGQAIYLADASKENSIAVNGATNINAVTSGIIGVAEAVRLAKMHPAGPKRMKITLGGWSDYARIGTAANGVKAANLMAKFVAYTFADGVDIDMEHLTPYTRYSDEFGALIAFITQLRDKFNELEKNWADNAQKRKAALHTQLKNCGGSCPKWKRIFYQTNINHLAEVINFPAPHLEISWTTRFNAFLPSLDYPDRFNYLSHDGGFPTANFTFETDNEGTWFFPQVAHLVDTVNIMGYDAGKFDGKPYKLDFHQIIENFAKYGNVSRSKINMGFEPGPQAAGGKWEGMEKDVEVAKEIKSKQTAGGVALWAVNPTPSAKNNASVWCNDTAWALKDVMKASFVYGNAPNYTRSDNGWWPGSTGDMDEEAVMV